MLKANPIAKKLETTKRAQRSQRKIHFIEKTLRALWLKNKSNKYKQ